VGINGEKRAVPDGLTVATLLESLGLAGQPCAVEVNGQVVPKRRHIETMVQSGDRIEVVTLVGGG
jgi:sulfur carrier protein